MMSPEDHSLASLVGVPLPGGTWSLAGYESWLTSDAVYAHPGEPHPINAFIGVQRGLGMTVSELFHYLQSDVGAGPLLAECSIDFPGRIEVDRDYDVRGTVVEVQRKSGRALGNFDLVTCCFELNEASTGNAVARVTNVYAIPRPGGAR
jgi:hypothetical protein